MKKLVFLALVLSLFIVDTSDARKKKKKYEVIDVTNGGSITGTIKAASKVDDPVMKIETKKPDEVEFCGTEFQSNMYIISPDLGVKNVVVALLKVKQGKAMPEKDYVINNLKCQFEPLVGLAFKGNNFVIKNSDALFHNTNLGIQLKGGKKRAVYNLALPNLNQVLKKKIKTKGVHSIKCDAHPWMRAYVYSSDSPYAALTDDSGKFEITDIPAGTYKVLIWHEGFGEVKQEITVEAGQATTLDHTFSK